MRSRAAPAEDDRENGIMADVPPASERFRVESRKSTLSLGRKARAFVANLLAGALFENKLDWPPIDVVLLDAATGGVVKRWHEHGNRAAELMTALKEGSRRHDGWRLR